MMKCWKSKHFLRKKLLITRETIKLRHLNKLAAILFLVGIFFLGACKKPKGDLDDTLYPEESKLFVNGTDTFSVSAYTLFSDSIKTSALSANLLGYSNDPLFGISKASIYTQVRMSSENNDFGNDLSTIKIDSVVLSLVVINNYGNDLPQSFIVKRVNEEIKSGDYYAETTFLTDVTSLGQVSSYIPNTKDSVVIKGVKSPPQIRIPLAASVGNELIGLADTLNNDAFIKQFQGLFIYVDTNSVLSSGNGAIYTCNLLHSASKLTVYYRIPNTVNSSIEDTLSYDFNINSSAQRISNFEHNYSTSEVINFMNNPVKGDSLLFVQGMEGTRVKIDIPYLSLLKQQGTLAISKAELIFTVDDNSDVEYEVSERLFLVASDKSGAMISTPDQSNWSIYFGEKYDESNKSYTFDVTRYVQQRLNEFSKGIDNHYGFYLVSEGQITYNGNKISLLGSALLPQRTVLKGTKRTSDRLKFKIYYTKID